MATGTPTISEARLIVYISRRPASSLDKTTPNLRQGWDTILSLAAHRGQASSNRDDS